MSAKHFLLFYEACDDYVAKRAPFRDLHLKHGWAAHMRGELVLGGALADPVDGAVLLFPSSINMEAPAYRQALTACDAPPLGLRH